MTQVTAVNRFHIALALALLLGAPAHAAAPSTPSTYDIEVLVFENRLGELEGGEMWTREGGKVPAEIKDAIAPGEEPAGESTLANVATALEKSGHYRVLARQRWQQTADAKSEAKPVRIQSAGKEMEGTLRFYLSRFLQIELNVQLRDNKSDTTYRLNEHRRVKIQETHYFDHPKLGVLVRVVQVGKG